MNTVSDLKLKVYMADVPAYLADVVSQLALFVDELWMLQVGTVDPESFVDEYKIDASALKGKKLFLSMLQDVLTQKYATPRAGTPPGTKSFQTSAMLAGVFTVKEKELKSPQKLNAKIWENSADSISKKLVAEPDIVITRAGFTLPGLPHFDRLNGSLSRRPTARAKSMFKAARLASIVAQEKLPAVQPKGMSAALELREELADYLIPFRTAMAKFIRYIHNQEYGPEFEEGVYSLITGEIEPCVREMKAVLKSPGKRVLKHLVSGGGLSPVLVGATVLTCIATIGGGTLAAATAVASVSAAALNAVLKAHQERKELLDPRKNGFALLLKLSRPQQSEHG